MKEDLLRLKDYTFTSRLIIGTGKFASISVMCEAIKASETQLVTVALKRFNIGKEDDLLSPLTQLQNIFLVPNTSGARNADEAVRAALLGRELTSSPFVKLEIHPDPYYLMPDPIETFEAAKILVNEKFIVLPYINADLVLAKRLEEVGCAAVMPLGAPIGSGRGLQTYAMIELIISQCNLPVIVDAGLRAPSEAATAMEIGCSAVLVNTAIAVSRNPVAMAKAFADAVKAGRQAFKAGLMTKRKLAEATSPLTSFLNK